jgi:large subunit ribosomal protein L14
MKAISSSMTKCLMQGSKMTCADNTGVKILQIISVRGYKGKWRTKPHAGVGSLVNCRVYKGTEKVRHQVFKVVIIRQRKEYRRVSGIRIKFEDNAGIVVNDDFEPQGTMIKGPVAREAVERFPIISKIASQVV